LCTRCKLRGIVISAINASIVTALFQSVRNVSATNEGGWFCQQIGCHDNLPWAIVKRSRNFTVVVAVISSVVNFQRIARKLYEHNVRPSVYNVDRLWSHRATKSGDGHTQDRSVSWLYLHAEADPDRSILWSQSARSHVRNPPNRNVQRLACRAISAYAELLVFFIALIPLRTTGIRGSGDPRPRPDFDLWRSVHIANLISSDLISSKWACSDWPQPRRSGSLHSARSSSPWLRPVTVDSVWMKL